MTTIRAQNNQRNAANDDWDVIHHETEASIVLYSDGTNVESNYIRQPGYGITTGVANTYVLTLSPALPSLAVGVAVSVKINVANTGASTLNVNGLGAKAIVDINGNALTSGALKIGIIYDMRYNGTSFMVQGFENLKPTVDAHTADNTTHLRFGATTGTANTYVMTLSPAPTLVTGLNIMAKINITNTGASTINVNSLGAKAIVDVNGLALTSGALKLDMVYNLVYNGTSFVVEGYEALKSTVDGKIDKSVLTAAGDIIYATGASTPAKLAKGSAYKSLNMNGGATAPEYQDSLQSLIAAAGDIIYGSAANTPAKLGIGTDGQALISSSGLPAWGNAGAKIVSGTYAGNGSTQSISTGVTPKLVIIIPPYGAVNRYAVAIASATEKVTVVGGGSGGGTPACTITTTGFNLTSSDAYVNASTFTYAYIAIG